MVNRRDIAGERRRRRIRIGDSTFIVVAVVEAVAVVNLATVALVFATAIAVVVVVTTEAPVAGAASVVLVSTSTTMMQDKDGDDYDYSDDVKNNRSMSRNSAITRLMYSPGDPSLTSIASHELKTNQGLVCLLVGCLTSQQYASVSQEQICSDTFLCCHTEIEAADQTFYLTQSQYGDPQSSSWGRKKKTDTGSASPSADPITPGAWQGSHGVPIPKLLV